MKAGDLICYNAGGMKFQTLGLVLQVEKNPWHHKERDDILVMWSVTGKWMPRRGSRGKGHSWVNDYYRKIVSGDIVWHELGNWFEVVK